MKSIKPSFTIGWWKRSIMFLLLLTYTQHTQYSITLVINLKPLEHYTCMNFFVIYLYKIPLRVRSTSRQIFLVYGLIVDSKNPSLCWRPAEVKFIIIIADINKHNSHVIKLYKHVWDLFNMFLAQVQGNNSK